jgi:hypothetical protein
LVIAVLAFHAVVPAGIEDRMLMSAIAPICLLAGGAIASWAARATSENEQRKRTIFGAVALVSVSLMSLWISDAQRPAQYRGYDAAAAYIIERDSTPVVLVSSGSVADVGMVATFAERDRHRPNSYVLRGSKLLATQDWNGRSYQLRITNATDLIAALDTLPVNWLLLDDIDAAVQPHHKVLQSAMASGDGGWMLVQTVQSQRTGGQGTTNVYHRRVPVTRPDSLRVDIRGRKIVVPINFVAKGSEE